MDVYSEFISQIAEEFKLKVFQVSNALKLMLEEECTVPFVARYRKEMTGSLDEVEIRQVRDRCQYLIVLDKNKKKYLEVIKEKCRNDKKLQLQFPDIKNKILSSRTKQELEDHYSPFKPKRRSKGQAAKEKGLDFLLEEILLERLAEEKLEILALKYVTRKTEGIPDHLMVKDEESALEGALHIFAENVAESADNRAMVRKLSFETGLLSAEEIPETKSLSVRQKVSKNRHKYSQYFKYQEPVSSVVAHRIMAVRRGEAERILKVSIDVEKEQILDQLKSLVFHELGQCSEAVVRWLKKGIEDAYRRLLAPVIETEIRLNLKHRAEEKAIDVFSNNLEKLLLLPPVPHKIVMGIDPGIRTGSKIAIVDETGKYLDSTTIHPNSQKIEDASTQASVKQLVGMIKEYHVQLIAIGNGTGSREVGLVVNETLRSLPGTSIKKLIVNEAGASVYSADEIAREEFSHLDITIRSAISIARRVQDPLAELVKIDPRAMGVGQYQHDVNGAKLESRLQEVVESCVNKVGVNLNTASYKLLSYVSGIGQQLAKNIVKHRDEQGCFSSRQELFNVYGFGERAFQQGAGFLRIPGSSSLLENSAVHPENYDLIYRIMKDLGKDISSIIGNKLAVRSIPWEKYVNDIVGLPTLLDISQELIKPNRDPREGGLRLLFSEDLADINHLKISMILQGTVTNVTQFGAFVDIGVHQDGLVHISELSSRFVKDPHEVVSVGQIVKVRVLDVDPEKKRIGLSMKQISTEKKATSSPKTTPLSAAKEMRERKKTSYPSRGKSREKNKTFTLDDLMKKFNS